MKLFKRFSIMQKGIGAAALVSALLALASCENMTTVPPATKTVTASKALSTPSFPERTTNDDGTPIENLTYAQRYYTVSQGLKRKISLSWNKVEIARYYEVYSAQNINDNFIKVGETTKAEFEDTVAAGATYYYKVRAVNSWGDYSEFSSVVKGTTLATPVITDIATAKDDATNVNSATIFWYMGNVGADTYAKDLVYELHAFKGSEETVVTVKAWDDVNQGLVEEYTFQNLDGNTEYMYRVDAYLASEQSDIESSPKVSKKTLALYTPISPEFVATQGESVDGVKLVITLPPAVQVTETKQDGSTQDYDFPVTFEIQRKESSQSAWTTIVSCLYCNGQTTAPANSDAYKYKEGDTIEYFDSINTSALSVSRGVKYDYRIISCMDLNFAKVNNLNFKSNIKSKEASANVSTGWAANMPTFKAKLLAKNINPSNPLVVDNYVFGFEAKWDAMGMEDSYKFVIRQNRRLFAADNGGAVDTYGKDTWLNDNSFIATLGAVNELRQTLDLSANPENVRGVYRYTFYIIPAKCEDINASETECLAKVEATEVTSVDADAQKAARQLAAKGGWTDFTILTWQVELGVRYKIEWNKYGADDESMANSLASGTLDDLPKNPDGSYTGECAHSGLEAGYRYKYLLATNNESAVANDDGTVPVAETLGKPDIAFTANSYTDINASFKQVLAAARYKVVLGQAGGFGGGVEFYLDKDGKPVDKDGVAASLPEGVSCAKGSGSSFPVNLSLAISKPYGYDKANLAGKETDLIITAMSESDPSGLEPTKRLNTGSKKVWTIGPAGLVIDNAQSFTTQDDKMVIKWKMMEGAAGYAIYRQRGVVPDGGSGYTENPLDVYYVTYDGTTGNAVMADTENPSSQNGSISAATTYDSATGTFTLTDIFRAKGNSTAAYDENQGYLELGIPYTYTVLPVLASGDKNPEDVGSPEAWKIPGADKTYENGTFDGVKMERFTMGYGLAIKAAKAESAENIAISWEKPESAKKDENLKATLLYRKKGSTEAWKPVAENCRDTSYSWEKADIINNKNGNPSHVYQALEFAVSYGRDSIDTSAAIDKAYTDDYLGEIKELASVGGEPKSVGYLFSLPTINYTPKEQYTETFTWYRYGYDNDRKYGAGDNGDNAVVYTFGVRNLNFSSKVFPIAQYTGTADPVYKGDNDWYDITFESDSSQNAVTVAITPNCKEYKTKGTVVSASGATIEDAVVTDENGSANGFKVAAANGIDTATNMGTHYGLLRVLRDYEHEYVITATHPSGVSVEHTIKCCRKITKEEFAKGVNLIIADSVYQAGVGENTYGMCRDLDNHYLEYKHWANGKITHTLKWGTDGAFYNHVFRCGFPGAPYDGEHATTYRTSAWSIAVPMQNHRSAVTNDRIYFLTTNGEKVYDDDVVNTGMTVTHKTGWTSYQGKVDFDLGKEGSRSVVPVWLAGETSDGVTTAWQLEFKKDDVTVCSTSDVNNKDKFLSWFPVGIDESMPFTEKMEKSTKLKRENGSIVYVYSYDGKTYNEWWPAREPK